ncbi:cilia- and flagella-associated protein 74 [Nycticebus coucang]|uniref:cilia- and flagella-associated protein 74 n=1 Tax=Nycticebus coucang TaxID=9470 RepID=UPI00234D3E3D|nr:cilia- and flagella-associated protein 74 [Nycticebus coucang]
MEEDNSLFPEDELLDSVPLLEDERDELEDPGFEAASLPQEAENGARPKSYCSMKQKNIDADKTKKIAVEDRTQTFHLRKTLSCLDKMHEEKDLFIQKTREELRACRQRMELLRTQQESLAAEIAAESAANNVAAIGRLQAASRRLCTELENERDLQTKIMAMLAENENAMWHIELEQGQLEDFRKSDAKQVQASRQHLQERAVRQLSWEKEAVGKAERTQLLRVRRSLHMQKEHGLRHQKLVEDAQKNRKIAMAFLKASLGRVRQQEEEEEAEAQEHLRRRMEAVLALKNSITANRETLRKFQAWSRAKGQLAEQRAQVEKEVVLAQGGDAFRHLLHQRRHQELEAQTRAFEEQQKLRRQEIVSRILKEEAEEESRKKQRPPSTTAALQTLRDKTWCYISDIFEGKAVAPAASFLQEEDDDEGAYGDISQLAKAVSCESVQTDHASIPEEDETLAEPEISGLWKEDHKPYQVPKEDVDRKPMGGTKMDKDILARTMDRLRSGLIHRQVASGREFKGCPFNSKPEIIHFKDFDVGKVYKKKITLINATYTINYCKLVGVEEHLRDFIHTHFDPPGPMSAGMSCEVLITFKPMINKDLEGNVSFMAQTGGFSVPLKCSTKKCSVSLDKELVDFGSYVVGETASRTITLTNVGGLGTWFRILPASDPCESDELQSVMKMSSLFTYEDKSEKAIPSFSEQQLEANEFSPMDIPSRKDSEKLDSKDQDDMRPAEAERLTVEEQAEIMLGEITEGELGPFSSIKVPIIFTPSIPGEVNTRFKVTFKNPYCPTLHFRALGVAMDVPVWVQKPNVDLKICMYDRLYQDSVLVHTRSKAALRLKFEVCKELRGHVELLPETGYIQALSSYSVQLKFLPRHSLPEDAGKYFDQESRVLEAPMTIWVADQMKPVGFTVHAIVTTSDLEISPSEVDFGYCTIYEAIRTQIRLCNRSLLPQEFGFVRLPKFVDIQPNDGFGTILPLETLQLDVLFQPTRAKEYNFELVCKSEINRCFKLSCRAVGVHPPLELSHHQIKFAATALYDTSVAMVYISNSHLSMNSLTHSVPRTGSEDAFPVGPTSFEFLPPPDSPITITPLVGTVLPGKRCLVQVAFRPVLPKELIYQEALQIANKETEARLAAKNMSARRKDLWKQSVSLLHNWDQQKQQLESRWTGRGFAQNKPLESSDRLGSLPALWPHQQPQEHGSLVRGHRPCVPPLPWGCLAPGVGEASTGAATGENHLVRQTCDSHSLGSRGQVWPCRPLHVVWGGRSPADKPRAGPLMVAGEQGGAGASALCWLHSNSNRYQAAQATLVRAFLGKFDKFVVPCVIASGDIKDRSRSEPLSFSPHNTLYLELWCPAVAPPVVVTSEKGKTTLNFGDVAVGHHSIKKVSIQNISRENLTVEFSVLDPNGPFVLLNPCGRLHTGQTQVLVLSFSPHKSILAQEMLDIITKRGTLTLTLIGTGVASIIMCSIEGDVLNMGYVIARESVSTSFKLQNNSSLPVMFSMRLDSLSGRRSKAQQLPRFLALPAQRTEVVGTQNFNGQSVFSVVPVKGIMDPGKTQDFTVTFSPDHESLYFSDRLQVVLFEKKISHQILLKGMAREHMMFVEGGDTLDVPVESLTVVPMFDPEHREGPPSPEGEELRPILVTLDYIQFDTDTPAPPATRELQVGCIRTTQPSPKKTVEFSLDSVSSLQHKGFSVEPSRGSVERGQTKTISISWVPPADFDPDHPLVVSALLQLKGDVKEVYKVIFVAQVVTGH